MKCLSTRRTPEGFRRRRYQTDGGSRFTTIEVPVEVWGKRQRTARLAEVAAQRPTAEARLRDGWKPLAVALDLGLSLTTVQRWAKALKS